MRIDYDNDLRIELPFFLEMVKKLNGSKLRDNFNHKSYYQVDCPECGKSIEPTNISRPKRGRKAGVTVATTSTKTVKENDELKDLIDETDDSTVPSDEDENDNLAEDISIDISKNKTDEETS